jgi:hypothetical protein
MAFAYESWQDLIIIRYFIFYKIQKMSRQYFLAADGGRYWCHVWLYRYGSNHLGRDEHPGNQGGTQDSTEINFTGDLIKPGGYGGDQDKNPNNMHEVV